jgi:hypothetical protein
MGLYKNIHDKRNRGEKPRPKGAKGAPTDAAFRAAAKTAKPRKPKAKAPAKKKRYA